MEKRKLGRTDLMITPIGFGGMEIQYTNWYQAKDLLNKVLDLGVNYIDTAPEYWASEFMIGQHLSKRRHEFYLATKCGDDLYGEKQCYRYDRYTCMRNLEDSLRAMKTDYVDVWQLHALVPSDIKNGRFDDVITCMEDAKKAGKVRFLGATIRNGQPHEPGHPDVFGYESIEEFASWEMLDVVQIVYGALTRLSENKIQQAYDEYGTGIIARGVVKKYREWYDEAYEKTKLWELFEEGESKIDFLIRYVLSHPALSGMVLGTKSPEHFEQNVKACEKGALSPEVYNEAKQRLEKAGFKAK